MVSHDLPAPDWDVWGSFVQASIASAVALSLDIDPDVQWARLILDTEYDRRFAIALNHIHSGDLQTIWQPKLHASGEHDYGVRLSIFAKWSERFPWDLPDQFPGRRAATNNPPAGWPWGAYETPLLKELAAAVRHFWTEYKPDSAPTKDQVIAWLTKRGRTLNEATAIAKIIRPHDLPDGPRTKRDKRNG